MRYIDKILNGREVVWRPLGEVCETVTPPTKLKRSEYNISGEIPIIDQGIDYISGYSDNSQIALNDGEYVLFGDHSEHIKYVDFAFIQGADGLKILKIPNNNAKYIYYCFLNYYKKVGSYKRHWSDAKDTLIPIPPRDVQEEIVEVLDKFTELERELEISLERELELRLKQYEYYRNKLLTFDDYKVEWRPLGEVGRVRMCKRILKDQTSDVGDIPFYKIGTFGGDADSFISKELFQEYKQKFPYPKKGDILISASGTIGKCVIYKGEEAYYQDSNIVWIDNNESIVLNKYLYYCYQIVKWKISVGGTIKRLYNDNLLKTIIPIPYYNDRKKSMDEQERIVEILDKFDKLVNSISEGLPREIELRRKQYEYYRNELLTFN